jgi:hypothetical protein
MLLWLTIRTFCSFGCSAEDRWLEKVLVPGVLPGESVGMPLEALLDAGRRMWRTGWHSRRLHAVGRSNTALTGAST